MQSDEEVAVASAAVVVICSAANLLLKKRKKCKRRWWMVSINKSRRRYNGTDLLIDLRRELSGKFENFCRMSAVDFEYLINKIGHRIAKKDTNMRKAIPVQERLAVTLRFLASGDSYKSLSYLFKFSPQVISTIIMEVCLVLNDELKDNVKLPKNQKEWQEVANKFEQYWHFPHCFGALDGKHVLIQSPYNSGSEFYNYKNTFSIVLMALVDAEYCFLFADVGCQGRMNDGGVFKNTTLFKKIDKNDIAFPDMKPLPGRIIPVPYVCVADDAFPLSNTILKPYPGMHLKGSVERIFNYRLSRARRIVENVFGIMVSVFRVLRTPMLLQPEKASAITMTCVLLHNFLRRSEASKQIYTPPGTFDSDEEGKLVQGNWRDNISIVTTMQPLKKIGRKSSTTAKDIRDEFAEYFVTNGRIHWQDEYS